MTYRKLIQYCDKQKHFPLIQLFDDQGNCLHQIVQNTSIACLTNDKNWVQHIKYQERQAHLYMSKKDKMFVFIGMYGLTYCVFPLSFENERSVSVIVGGYILENIQQDFTKIKQNLPILSHDEIMDTFVAFGRQLRSINNQVNNLTKQIEIFLKSNLEKNYTAKELGQLFFCHPQTIRRQFKKEAGMTFQKCYSKMKIEFALKEWNKGKLTKFEIAQKVGYASESSLNRAIKRHLAKK
ncbi:MAG: AraC family transcriptional regulator [Streptococcaceae bacterium]|jgi:AraC-like DNA-binding protein|nr:AraC family transcriptional regulator [Streptococcaceae bacterium]